MRRSKASEEFIKRNYSKKERGEEARDIRDVAVNKLDGYPILEEKDKQKAKEHNKANIRKYYESPEQKLVTLGIIGSGKGLSHRTKILKILELNF